MPEEREFDRILEDTLSVEILPDTNETQPTPWQTAMLRIVWGIGLTTFTLNFLYLQYLLPTLGVLLLWLGGRTLRKENRWFTAFWAIGVLKLAAQFVRLVLLAVPGMEPVLMFMAYASIPFNIIQMVFLWQGIKAVRRAAGQPDAAGAAGALAVWQVVLSVLAVMGVSGWLFGLPFLLAYGFTLYHLFKLPALLDGAGYAVHAAPVRVSDNAAGGIYAGALLVCILAAMFLTNRFPMNWTPARTELPVESAAGQHLLALGFPESTLRDLTQNDLAGLEEATDIYTKTTACYFPKHQYGIDASSYHLDHEPDYDASKTQLIFTHTAVELPDGVWKVFHHFEWVKMPTIRHTECMQFWPASHIGDKTYGYDWTGGAAGRVLYDRDGVTYESPYHTLEFQTYTSESWWDGPSTQQDLFAAFSMPRKGEDCRGYVTYTVREKNDVVTLFSSWNNYTHQMQVVYPAQTALDHTKFGVWNYQGAFRTAQTALQFKPGVGLLGY